MTPAGDDAFIRLKTGAPALGIVADDAAGRAGEGASAARDRRPTSLASAIRVARAEGAERSQALGELRDAELARLELLREMLAPMLAEIPAGIDLFDTGVVPGEHPRLFIDMIAFVEMAHDRRTYRLLQDRRDGRVVLAEAEGVGAMVSAVTGYVARRLVERDRMLASLGRGDGLAETAAPPGEASRERHGLRRVFGLLRLLVDGIGFMAIGAAAWLALLYTEHRVPVWLIRLLDQHPA